MQYFSAYKTETTIAPEALIAAAGLATVSLSECEINRAFGSL